MCEQSPLNGVIHVLVSTSDRKPRKGKGFSLSRDRDRVPSHHGAMTGPTGRIADFQGTETYVHYFGEW